MVVDRQPFTQSARVVAWLLAAICLTTGSAGVALGLVRANLRLALAAAGVLVFGAFYAGAAWRGRPWRWR
jgi:hypothetical protein